MKQYDVIVVGAGHAGIEAAHAAARMGASVALVSMKRADMGTLSCNPAIGGIGKGHLVREIDALDGVMARWADRAGIQFRLLNRSKGPAVQGPRTQIDRDAYRTVAHAETIANPAITFVAGEVSDLHTHRGHVTGVEMTDGSSLLGATVILTTGTFLKGRIHIGHESWPAGRNGDDPSNKLADRLLDHGLKLGRLKTGTPPRLDRATIAWSEIDRQSGDPDPEFLSMETSATAEPQIECGVTQTSAETHEIIRSSLNDSALYGGALSGKGPRYCPSVEDKVVRFADKDSHTVYLEPEGIGSSLVYPNGISTSLPADCQIAMVRSIPGLHRAEIVRPGYAIEYDYSDPRALGPDLSFGTIEGLYLAGQINGTTGYEEAATQGLVAGASAASRVLGRDPLTFDRSSSYIGVLIDDLTRDGVTEPYRMFTSRAEYRLGLRCDNAEVRLTDGGRSAGLVSDAKWGTVNARRRLIEGGLRDDVEEDDRDARHARRYLEAEAVYAPYLERQTRDIERLKENASLVFRDAQTYELPGLTVQQREKLRAQRPRTLAEALRIEGMSPAAGLVLLAAAKSESTTSDARFT